MRTIHKFPIDNKEVIAMPTGARILSVQYQGRVLTLWAEVDTDQPPEAREFEVFGTGFKMPDRPLTYLATVQEGRFVWHVYEVVPLCGVQPVSPPHPLPPYGGQA